MAKKTLVIGASENPSRYAYKAAHRLLDHGHPVVLFAIRAGNINGIDFLTTFPEHIADLDTVTLYINAKIQEQYYANILALKPKRVLFNPGTENPVFEEMLRKEGIQAEEACTLVLLGLGEY